MSCLHLFELNCDLRNSRMAATTMHGAIGSIQAHRGYVNASSQNGMGNYSVKMVSKGFGIDMRLLGRSNCCSRSWKLGVVHASTPSVADPVQAPSSNTSSGSQKKSSNLLLLLNVISSVEFIMDAD